MVAVHDRSAVILVIIYHEYYTCVFNNSMQRITATQDSPRSAASRPMPGPVSQAIAAHARSAAILVMVPVYLIVILVGF